MLDVLANAEVWDPSQSDLILILLGTAGIGCVCGLVGLVMALVRRAPHRHASQIDFAVMFWGLVAIGSILYAAITQLKWAKESYQQMMSGYVNPQIVGPSLPWLLWIGLAEIYLLILGWTAWGLKRGRS